VLYLIRTAIVGKRVMVILDSDHHKQTVLDELREYAPMVSPGCYLIVEDTVFGREIHEDHKDDGPADALDEWLPDHPEFQVDRSRELYGVSDHPGGWLLRL
jgi:cephalosporin hydroxylase